MKPAPCSLLLMSRVEAGRGLNGVPVGVPLGVVLPARDFLEEERGVTLLLRKLFTGVDRSSRGPPLGVVLASLLSDLRDIGVVEGIADAASRGVTGDFAVRFVASAGINGLLMLVVLYLSAGIFWRRKGLYKVVTRCLDVFVMVYRTIESR